MNAYDFLWQRLHEDRLFGTDIDDLLQEIADIMDEYASGERLANEKFRKERDELLLLLNKNQMTQDQIKQLWGDDLWDVFAEHIDENGWLTAEWQNIIEDEIPRFDKHYNDNPLYKNTYGRMYLLEYEENEDRSKIRPIEQG